MHGHFRPYVNVVNIFFIVRENFGDRKLQKDLGLSQRD